MWPGNPPNHVRPGFKGVSYYKRTGRWEAHIWKTGKQIYLGAFVTALQAAGAYDRAVIHFRGLVRGMNADLNFRVEDYQWELQKLIQISDTELVNMLLKQSLGNGTRYPKYP